MTFLGCDVEQLRQWSRSADTAVSEATERIEHITGLVRSARWEGPDHDAFVQTFTSHVETSAHQVLERLHRMALDAARQADDQDRASAADGTEGESAAPVDDRKLSSPGTTEKSGPPVPVPDDVKKQITDPEAIRQKALDVKQGGMGDCFYLASLAAVAETNPEFIRDNIWFKDGRYHVRLYEQGFFSKPHEKIVDVDPTVAQNGVRDKDGQVSWMSVYEAAYAQHEGGYSQIEKGGLAQDALPIITGKQTCTDDDEPSFDQIRQEFDKGNLVVADTATPQGDDHGWWDIINNDDGPVPKDTVASHQYIVRGFTSDGKIIMQNPWGPDGGYGEDHEFKPGQLVLTEDEYRDRFENVTLTQDPKTDNPKRPYIEK